LSLDRINNTRVGLVGGQRIFSPLLFLRASLSLLATSKTASDSISYRAAALVPVSTLTFSSFGRRPPSPFRSLSPRGRLARLTSAPLSNLCLDSDLRIRIQFCLPPNSLEARSRSLAFNPITTPGNDMLAAMQVIQNPTWWRAVMMPGSVERVPVASLSRNLFSLYLV
jgi:hypothetical protein